MVLTTSNQVATFIESLSLPQAIAESVLLNMEDCQVFYTEFYGRNHYLVDDILDYRTHKIMTADITYEKFNKMCNEEGMYETFKNTFFQTLTLSDFSIVTNAIDNGKTTLEKIFNSFKENPNQNILRDLL